MSKLETPMIRWYWDRIGGTLVEEYLVVRPGPSNGPRRLDGLIVLGGPKKLARTYGVTIEDRDVVVVQAKNHRLGMYLMGQALFSAELVRPFRPRSIRSVALCSENDSVLRPLLKRFPEVRVVVCPPHVCGRRR